MLLMSFLILRALGMSKTIWFQLKGSGSEGLRFEPHTRSADEVDHYTQGKLSLKKVPSLLRGNRAQCVKNYQIISCLRYSAGQNGCLEPSVFFSK